MSRGSPCFERESLEDLVEDGRVVWEEDMRVGWRGSGIHE
jgi:hypothetical protein